MTTATTLAARIWPRTAANTLPRALALILAGSILLAVSAHVKVPFWPVPMTMQTFVVLMIGATYGWRLAGTTLVAYLIEGVAGLPVFTGGVGPLYMAGPTGGYLVGFAISAIVAGWLVERGMTRRPVGALLTFLFADALVFVLGVGYLSTLIGMDKAIAGGLLPFLAGEALKIVLATALTVAVSPSLRRAG
ncbi:MAG TPA: biotin transporter BioY [Magnetospirillaceae bacterium]|jgi:biotin transport system substrate-specific component